jgi:RNA polymerase sigma-70 factor (ECF subfamily)
MPATASGTSSSLLSRARNHDAAAWRRLVQLYGPLVYGWVRRAGLAEHDAADVVQEVFQALFTSLDRFALGQSSGAFRSWLWTIAHRRACDHFRRGKGQPAGVGGTEALQRMQELADEPPGEDAEATHSAQAELVRRALAMVRPEFADHTWRACMLTALEGQSPADVAAELDMTVGAVYVARSRVLKRVRAELEGLL